LVVSGRVSVRSPPWPAACELSWRGLQESIENPPSRSPDAVHGSQEARPRERLTGITFDSANDAVQDGHLVCRYLAGGKTGAGIGGDIMDNTDLTAHQAAVFVVEAASAYCPGYLDQMTA
jgi:hypothetical protein